MQRLKKKCIDFSRNNINPNQFTLTHQATCEKHSPLLSICLFRGIMKKWKQLQPFTWQCRIDWTRGNLHQMQNMHASILNTRTEEAKMIIAALCVCCYWDGGEVVTLAVTQTHGTRTRHDHCSIMVIQCYFRGIQSDIVGAPFQKISQL